MLPEEAAILVGRVQRGDGAAGEDLYRVVCQAATARLSRCGAPRESAEDHAHDVFLIVLQSIQRGELREAGRLMGFVATIAHRHVAAHIASAVRARNAVSVADTPVPDWRANPEQQAIEGQHFGIAMRALRGIPAREREILERRYLDEQPVKQICAEMGMTTARFQNMKHRAKVHLYERARTRLGFDYSRGALQRSGDSPVFVP